MRESETKEVLLDKLIGIQDIEAAKRIEEMDADLISECSEYVIELTGEELPSESALEQMKLRLLQRLFGRNGSVPKYRKGMLRKLLIAAIIVILIVAIAISMMPLGTNDESLIHRWGFGILRSEQGERVDYGDYLSLINNGEMKEYATIRRFIQKTHMDILVPTTLPKGVSVRKVKLNYDYVFESPKISFMTNDPAVYSIIIYPGREIESINIMEKNERVGTLDCGFSITPDWCQCDFNYNGNGYSITAKTYEELILILNNMKGSLEK